MVLLWYHGSSNKPQNGECVLDVGTRAGAARNGVQRQASACRRSTVQAAKAAPPEVPAWPASTRRHATNVKYALSHKPVVALPP